MPRRVIHLYILLAVAITVILIVLFSEPVAGWAQRLDGESFGFKSGPYDVALFVGLCTVTAVVIAFMILRLNQSNGENNSSFSGSSFSGSSFSGNSALKKLEKQFARGEISQTEFERHRKSLLSFS